MLVERAVASIDQPTFDDTLKALELAGAEIGVGYGRSAFMAQVHPDAAVRDAGQAAEEKITKWRVAIAFREDVYRAVAAFAETRRRSAHGRAGTPAGALDARLPACRARALS